MAVHLVYHSRNASIPLRIKRFFCVGVPISNFLVEKFFQGTSNERQRLVLNGSAVFFKRRQKLYENVSNTLGKLTLGAPTPHCVSQFRHQ